MSKLKCTEENARRVLKELGDTEEDVAASLKRRRIKGYRGDPINCPIALYLQRRLNIIEDYRLSVSRATVVCFDALAEWKIIWAISYTYPVRQFIAHFDGGFYPKLAEGE